MGILEKSLGRPFGSGGSIWKFRAPKVIILAENGHSRVAKMAKDAQNNGKSVGRPLGSGNPIWEFGGPKMIIFGRKRQFSGHKKAKLILGFGSPKMAISGQNLLFLAKTT